MKLELKMNIRWSLKIVGVWLLMLGLTVPIAQAETYDEILLENRNIVRGTITSENNTEITLHVIELLIFESASQYQRITKDGLTVTLPRSEIRQITTGIISPRLDEGDTVIRKNALHLSLDEAVEIAMGNSYRMRMLELGIERTRHFLRSRQASLKSKVSMRLDSPEIKSISERKWNSTLQKDEIVHEDTRRYQMDLSIRQPVVLFGYPTNGYLSLNNRIYRYLQKDDKENDIDYYNRFFIQYEQPLFQPNFLKNDIEDAELDYKKAELDYVQDRVRLIDDVYDDYYDLFEATYRRRLYQLQVDLLERVEGIVRKLAATDPAREIELTQIEAELGNAREDLLQNDNSIRLEVVQIKRTLHLGVEDSVFVDPAIKITPVSVDVEKAIQYGLKLRPLMRSLEISKRKYEIDVDDAKGYDAFHVNLEMTYGLENQEDRFDYIWEDYDRSHSVSLNAYIPIWDWGRRKERIQGYKINLRRSEMRMEETADIIRSNIINAVENLVQNQQRVVNMQRNLDRGKEITDVGIDQYQKGAISLQALLLMLSTRRETEGNFLGAYLAYRQALLSLMVQTYYDYEEDISLLEKFGVAINGDNM
jgi:outer membrane protein